MNLGELLHNLGQKMPGNNFFSNNTFGRLISGGIPAAVQRNNWRIPRPGDQTQTSIDDIAGMGSANNNFIRQASRGAGLAMGGYGLGTLFGGGGAAATGYEGLPEAGYPTSAPAEYGGGTGGGWQDYLRRFGGRGANMLSNMGGLGGALAGSPTPQLQPIQPIQTYRDPLESEFPAGLMALLMANYRNQNQAPDEGPLIGRGGAI